MRLGSKILIIAGIIVLSFGLFILGFAWLEPTGGYRTTSKLIFSDSFLLESFETETIEIELENDTNYSFELSTYYDEPLDVSWIVRDPNGLDLKIFDLRQLSHTIDQGVISRTIDGKFNSTVFGNYDILVAEVAGQEYSTDFKIYELSHLWMDRYKHFFNPAPTIASPFILIGITLLLKGVASAIPQAHAPAYNLRQPLKSSGTQLNCL